MKSGPSLRSETHFVHTRDGWRIALHNYGRSSKKFPVFLCHGMGSNRHDLDFGTEKSLAKFLYKNGYDVWVVELRGAGASSKPRPWNRFRFDWCFDDYISHDLPAALHYVIRKTGAGGVHWVGHSMGGMLAYPMMQTIDDGTIRTATTIGAPLMTDKKNAELGGFLKQGGIDWLRFLPFIPYSLLTKIAVPLAPALPELFERVLSEGNGLMWNVENMERDDMLTLGGVALEDLPVPLVRQMQEWHQTNSFCSYYRRWDYVQHLRRVTAPLHVIAGAADGLCPPADCKVAYDLIGSKDKRFSVFGRETGQKHDYGHIDLVLGRYAAREVFPEILSWIEEFNDL